MGGRQCEIQVNSCQVLGDDTEETLDMYKGNYLDRGDKKYLSYRRETEDGQVECLLSYEAGRITMSQQGGVRSKMEFVPGKKTISQYLTPLGNMDIPIYTRGLSVEEKDETLNIMIDYDIATDDAIKTRIDINVTLK
ncbi:MAG: DUF1934 domain-containing protein [Pseudobutyrivibrio sp.]|nr:DUF1934 domain-containing protein [Pseudobutyrivibrio sp.]